jgi:hypothetical protein
VGHSAERCWYDPMNAKYRPSWMLSEMMKKEKFVTTLALNYMRCLPYSIG